MKLPKQFTFVFVASIAFCLVGSVYAESLGGPGGEWPKSWPKELEPLRKQAWTWVHGEIEIPSYEIPFANREEFESAWSHILKLKRKGAPLTLSRGPHVNVRTDQAAGVRILSHWAKALYDIELVVDGDIVDLNSIPLPANTPIIDKRFADRNTVQTGMGRAKVSDADGKPVQPSAADLVREVYEAEAWILQVDSCLIRTKGVQSKPTNRESTQRPSAAEFEQLRDHGVWQETQHWQNEIAWDKRRVRAIQDYAESQRMVTAWDGRIMTVHEKAPWHDREHYGIYDDSRKDSLLSRRVNLWHYGGLVTNDRGAWWYTRDPEKQRHSRFLRPEDFRYVGKSLVDGRGCHVVESRAGRMRLSRRHCTSCPGRDDATQSPRVP